MMRNQSRNQNQKQRPFRSGLNLFNLLIVLVVMALSSFSSCQAQTCDSTYTNKMEGTAEPIGYCVQTCPDVATAKDYECTVLPATEATETEEVVCPCKNKIGEVQRHIGLGNKTSYTAVICNSNDYSEACEDACAKSMFGEGYTTPYKCKSFTFVPDAKGQYTASPKAKQAFCACGAPAPPLPKNFTGDSSSSEGQDMPSTEGATDGAPGDMTTNDKTKRAAGNSKSKGGRGKGKQGGGKGKGNGKGGKGQGQGQGGFPQILTQFLNALKYVRDFFRRNQGN